MNEWREWVPGQRPALPSTRERRHGRQFHLARGSGSGVFLSPELIRRRRTSSFPIYRWLDVEDRGTRPSIEASDPHDIFDNLDDLDDGHPDRVGTTRTTEGKHAAKSPAPVSSRVLPKFGFRRAIENENHHQLVPRKKPAEAVSQFRSENDQGLVLDGFGGDIVAFGRLYMTDGAKRERLWPHAGRPGNVPALANRYCFKSFAGRTRPTEPPGVDCRDLTSGSFGIPSRHRLPPIHFTASTEIVILMTPRDMQP